MIDWESSETSILLNPRLNELVRKEIIRCLPVADMFASHLWFLTSGTTGKVGEHKCVALSKKAVLCSAQAVNKHLDSTSEDVWLNALPQFHVGGVGILARAHLSDAKVITAAEKWDALAFHQQLIDSAATLTALVPTQLHDLVTQNLEAPKSLRAVVIGGGRLEVSLAFRAKELGWKALPSYGLTEASSQVATAVKPDGELQILDHVDVRSDMDGYLELKGGSLLTAYGVISNNDVHIYDPKIAGWLKSEDRGNVDGKYLMVLGRGADFVKIGGESVDLTALESRLDALKARHRSFQSTALIARQDERLGHAVHLAVEGSPSKDTLQAIESFQADVLPFERIQSVQSYVAFPRTATGKVQKKLLLDTQQ